MSPGGGERLPPIGLAAFRSAGHAFAVEARFVESMTRADSPPAALPETLFELALDLPGGPGSLRVEGPVELVSVEVEDIHPLPPALAARCSIRGLRALARRGEGFLLVLDPRLL